MNSLYGRFGIVLQQRSAIEIGLKLESWLRKGRRKELSRIGWPKRGLF
jgi:hypothetical protein